MIPYQRSAFGLNLLFRVHGSATYRSIVPGLIATAFFAVYRRVLERHSRSSEMEVQHPYAIGVIVSGITFLIIFRASQGYSRYWEATTSVYAMMSKWMDATVHTAVYHMQSDRYQRIKPPSYNHYHYLDAECLTRDRERVRVAERGTQGIMHRTRVVARSINEIDPVAIDRNNSRNGSTGSLNSNRIYQYPTTYPLRDTKRTQSSRRFVTAESARHMSSSTASYDNTNPRFLTGDTRLDGNWSRLFDETTNDYHGDQNGKPSTPAASARSVRTGTFYDPEQKTIPKDSKGFASTAGGRTPPLFLQELAHLSSLLTAVAFATLRNDVDGAESPLDYYEAGDPWPEVDPSDIPELYETGLHRFGATLLYFLGYGRSPEARTRYNAMRPLPVIGGVSDAEIRLLQLARGPYAKTQLCWYWLSEFIIRENLEGSLGDVGAPIVSRVAQFLGDGMSHYNHGRKVMSIPFPFPHAQLSAIFVMVMIVIVPFLMENYCEPFWVGALLTFLGVVCLTGIHEVARELENPFRNIPNELPVVTMMAEYNEALLTMYAGYHPDFFWDPPRSSSTMETSPSKSVQPSSSYKSVESAPVLNDSRDLQMDQLRGVVQEQGRVMTQMLEEQARLNKLLQATLSTPPKQ